jgi:hypothetical protein
MTMRPNGSETGGNSKQNMQEARTRGQRDGVRLLTY